MTHPADKIANEFIERAMDDFHPISMLQTMYLVYIAHGWMLAIHDRKLVVHKFFAQDFGPYNMDLFRKLDKHTVTAWEPIYDVMSDVDTSDFDDDELDIITKVANRYSKFSSTYLGYLCVKPGTPYAEVWNPLVRRVMIHDDLIKDYYIRNYETDGLTPRKS